MFSETTRNEIGKVARQFRIEPAALMAVAQIESGGSVFALIDGRQEPLIRFEGHYFDRRLSGNAQAKARAAGLASPTAGAVANPATQAARWRLLEMAATINRNAAYESTSWGIGQVMGAHWSMLGFESVAALVAKARSGAAGQAELMARYIDRTGLGPALRNQDWERFARGYNGPNFRKNAYHTKLAAAYTRHAAGNVVVGSKPVATVLARGARGEAVKDLQRQLFALGYPLAVDGIFGAKTQAAVIAFQRAHGLAADAIAGPQTMAAISHALPFGKSGWKALKDWLWSSLSAIWQRF